MKRDKAQLELNLTTTIKDNKDCFYKCIINKRKAKENFHLLLDEGRNTVRKDEETVEGPNAFNSKTHGSSDTQPPELEDKDKEHHKNAIIPGEMVSDLLHYLNMHKSIALGGMHPRVLRELVEMLTKTLSIIYQQSWLSRKFSVDWMLTNEMPIFKKMDLGRRIWGPTSLSV
ncbi:rna-directed dna polymerase from mobile element jockey-like [Willisornis vidua]|uniref:Rna-directed dna polymerase from mobile element jockey-like n=1 Tax=Willisornis vidua TaxID=1566151 RepID=A0ABQ9DIU2_9PASS|nr:rna-directed dna polymerase from mobile element jockey-like [Willisornis vidua]